MVVPPVSGDGPVSELDGEMTREPGVVRVGSLIALGGRRTHVRCLSFSGGGDASRRDVSRVSSAVERRWRSGEDARWIEVRVLHLYAVRSALCI